jgi:Major Facilitator Superfamily
MQAGLLFLPLSLAVVGGSQLSFRIVSRADTRALFGAGGLIAAAGLGWLSRLGAGTDLLWVIVPASVAMAGGGLMFAPITVAATSGAPPEMGGLASGLLNTSRQIGGALGLAVLGTIAAAHSDGYGAALGAGAVVFAATAIAGALLLPGRLVSPATGEAGGPPRWKDRRALVSR